MSYTIIYPDTGADPSLLREDIHPDHILVRSIGALEPCDPTELESDILALWLSHQRARVSPGTVVRLSARVFACVREHVIAFYHLA